MSVVVSQSKLLPLMMPDTPRGLEVSQKLSQTMEVVWQLTLRV